MVNTIVFDSTKYKVGEGQNAFLIDGNEYIKPYPNQTFTTFYHEFICVIDENGKKVSIIKNLEAVE